MFKVFRNPDVMWREEDEAHDEASQALDQGEDVSDIGTSVLIADGVMVTLNLLGTEIWKLCDGRTVDELVEAILLEFDVEPDVIRRDVLSFLQDLQQRGLIFYG